MTGGSNDVHVYDTIFEFDTSYEKWIFIDHLQDSRMVHGVRKDSDLGFAEKRTKTRKVTLVSAFVHFQRSKNKDQRSK